MGLAMGLAEVNPVMRWAMNGFSIAALAAVKLLVVGGAMCLRAARVTERSSRVALPWAATVFVNAVVLATG